MQKLHIIDALGPFSEENITNWSKVDFSHLEHDGHIPHETRERIVKRFDVYLDHVASLGYDSISIDDLAHLVILPFYNPSLQDLLTDYRILYTQLFHSAKQRRMKIFVNTDYLFYNNDIQTYLKESDVTPASFFLDVFNKAIELYPDIEGIILRIGENDGKDVKNAFVSQLKLRTARQANRLLKKILPSFEEQHKLLLFRTWTVGVYKIGDLIWNEKTYNTVFSSIRSNALIISMKFGDTDFMRYLTLNPLFFKGPHKKIIELQTRREWEGMGLYPSFIGHDYYTYLEQLKTNKDMVGIHVWCQTGGWAKQTWNNITYLDNSSFWNELNTEVTIALYKSHMSVDDAIRQFCKTHTIKDTERFIQLLEISENVIKDGLYIRELAQQSLYFRRTRVPTLLWMTWDKVLMQSTALSLIRSLVTHPHQAIEEGDKAVLLIDEMIALAYDLDLRSPVIDSLIFQRATFALFAQLRRYILDIPSVRAIETINHTIRQYEKQYPQHYSIPQLRPLQRQRRLPRRLTNLFLRETTVYRKRDKIIFITSSAQKRLVRLYLRRSKSHLLDQSMGLDVLFK